MHILVTNDDGPPSQSSPYIHSLIRHLEKEGHTISVCIPHTQRSWIGKAHMIGKTLKPVYYRPPKNSHGDDAAGTTHALPSTSGDVEEWVLIDGTPASCVQIGLHHFFQDKGPFDLVVSGPNYGRNTTAVFALSSGTMGAALEAAVCQQKSIALSFAFFDKNHDPEIIDAACRHSVKVIDALYKQWPTDRSTDLYSVNVPLVAAVETNKTVWTKVLQNYWQDGSCFEEIDGYAADAVEEEHQIREGENGEVTNGNSTKGHKHKHFKWAPKFPHVYKSAEEAGPGNDGWVIKEGQTSITPLKANFAKGNGPAGDQEFKFLDKPIEEAAAAAAVLSIKDEEENSSIQIHVSYDDAYVQPLIVEAIQKSLPPSTFQIVHEQSSDETTNGQFSQRLSSPEQKALQIVSYETIDFEHAAEHSKTFQINSYMIRKALIRKHYLSLTVDHWVAKNPTSVLKTHFKRSEAFEVDYAEFLDDALVEAFDLRESLDRNDQLESDAEKDASAKEWWILKPGMSDRGQGIKLFSTVDELQTIFDKWEADRPDSDDEEEDEEGRDPEASVSKHDDDGDYIDSSQLRHFVAQPYIHPPLLLAGDERKFHIRTYVLCVGGLIVYVYKPMLALFAAKKYTPPWVAPDDIESFLTNTCLQDSPNENSVRSFWDLDLSLAQQHPAEGEQEASQKITHDEIFSQICAITGEIFEAATRAMPIHFQPLPNAFEVFGLDFMLDAQGVAYLLEINAFPDFKQTGNDLQEIVAGFWRGVVREGVAPFFGIRPMEAKEEAEMVKVRDIDLGRR